MSREFLAHYWALLIASIIGTAVLLFVLFRVYRDSAFGRLGKLARNLRVGERAARSANREVAKAAAKLERMRKRADSVKPRHAEEATGRLQDARALGKIAGDQVLVARNLLRKHILEEYPPRRHAVLRARYLGAEETGKKPFIMGE
jgi:hypothetical protein